jgi:hypothetical protein
VNDRHIRQTAVPSGIAVCCCLAFAAAAALGFPDRPARAAAGGFSVLTIATRPGITVRIAVAAPVVSPPPEGTGRPLGTFLMFPGGNGAGHFRTSGAAVILGDNFLVRTASRYVARGWVVAIVDVPSDHLRGMPDAFRTSAAHTADVRVIVRALAAQFPRPVYLVGTSAGTTSVAHLGTVFTDGSIAGIVLTSAPRTIAELPLARVNVPVLIVHHRADACRATSPSTAELLPGRFTGAPKVAFVWVRGGSTPISGPCDPFAAHGFFGVEEPVVDVIARWAGGGDVPPAVGR